MFGRKKKPTFYDLECERLQKEIAEMKTGSAEYKEAMDELGAVIAMRKNDKESRNRFNRGDKGQMVVKGIGVVGILAAIFGMSKFEVAGNTYTGEKRRWADTLISNLGKFNFFS